MDLCMITSIIDFVIVYVTKKIKLDMKVTTKSTQQLLGL